LTWCANLNRRTVSDSDVEEELLSYALKRILSGMYGSWFQQRKLTFQEFMYLTYDIVRRVPAHIVHKKHRFGPNTIADWGLFCSETMLVYMEGCSEKIGGANKTVEIDESKFGRRKCHRCHPVKERWVLAVLSESPVKRFSLPFRTGPLTL
jgi:hypothetical protein